MYFTYSTSDIEGDNIWELKAFNNSRDESGDRFAGTARLTCDPV